MNSELSMKAKSKKSMEQYNSSSVKVLLPTKDILSSKDLLQSWWRNKVLEG
jgi:hypothetical protein